MKASGFMLAAALLTGCASPHFQLHIGKPDSAIDAAPALTVPIGLVADTQFHESRGVASRYLGLGGDELVGVTIRTGQQVIGAGDVLTAALQRTASLPLVIHAGDAIDVSCQTEWNRFRQVMADSPRGAPGASSWLFTPGNHDGFLAGNIFPLSTDSYQDAYWANLCNAGQMWTEDKQVRHSFIAKHHLVRDYVRWLGGTFGGDDTSRACDSKGTLCWVAYAPASRPWESYLVQLVRLPSASGAKSPVYALMLDSSDYERRPYLTSFVAGVQGSLSSAQMEAASSLLQPLPPHARFFFVTHHPTSDWRGQEWSAGQRTAWTNLLQDSRSLRFVVSAHTHTGFLRRNANELGTFAELNTGSLADAPIYLRTIEFRQGSNGRIGVRSEAEPIAVDPHRCAQLLPRTDNPEYDYDVDGQRSESDRAGERSPGPVAIGSALYYFFNFWESKHKELRPQLLAYADIVEVTMPADVELRYIWTSTPTGPEEETLSGPKSVADALRRYANCRTGLGKCSAQAKGNLLMALEAYYAGTKTPTDVKVRAHELRLCLAVMATNDSAADRSEVRRLYRDIAKPWAIWLTQEGEN